MPAIVFAVSLAGREDAMQNLHFRRPDSMSAGPDPSYADLRARAREQLNSGRLPTRVVESVAAGYGSPGKICSLCEEPITPTQVEYEVVGYVEQPLILHMTCYAAWRDECLQRAPRIGTSSAPPANPAPSTNVPERA